MEKSPGWLRGVEIGLGVIAVILSIYGLAFPAALFVSLVQFVAIILIIVGIEKIITGIFVPAKGRWATIGLGVVVLIFAILALSYPGITTYVLTVFIGISLLFNGFARIAEGMSGKHSGWVRFFLIGVGILSIIIAGMVLAYPVLGAVLAGIVVAVALLITGIQMIAVGAAGHKITPGPSASK